MEKKYSDLIQKGMLVLFFGMIIVLTSLLFAPFLLTVLTAGVLAYITYPLYLKLLNLVKNKFFASSLMIIFVFLVIAIPLSLMGGLIIKESISGINSFADFAKEGIINTINGECANTNTTLCTFSMQIKELSKSQLFSLPEAGSSMISPLGSLLGNGLKSSGGFFATITGAIVHFFIMLFALFFFFVDGDNISSIFIESIPLPKKYKIMIVKRFKDTTSGVIYGQVLTSVIQGVVASIGFTIFGINSPVFFGVLTAFTSMIPFIGAAGVWVPLAIIKIVSSLMGSDIASVWLGIGLVVYGTLIISTIDNIVKPKFIGDKAQIHPLLALIGVLGGISVFGLIGVLFGPLIIAMFLSVFEIYRKYIGTKQ